MSNGQCHGRTQHVVGAAEDELVLAPLQVRVGEREALVRDDRVGEHDEGEDAERTA